MDVNKIIFKGFEPFFYQVEVLFEFIVVKIIEHNFNINRL